MYQLSHLLIEQRNILSTLREQNSIEDSKKVSLDENEDGKRFHLLLQIFSVLNLIIRRCDRR